MQFVKPAPFQEAVDKVGVKTPIGSAMSSAEWRDVPVALRERALFSSRVESIRFLQRARDAIGDFVSASRETLPSGETVLKVGSRAEFVDQMRAFALGEGMGPLDTSEAGTIKDITSEKRLGLIFDVQTQQAGDYGYWRQGMSPAVLDEFPAQRFIRVKKVKEARQSHTPYEDQVYLKTDPIWARVINEDFGVPWGPWGWGCGHDVEDVDRGEAESLGLVKAGEKVEPDRKNFNENLKASSAGMDPDLVEKLKRDLGRQLVIDGDEMRWQPQTSNANIQIPGNLQIPSSQAGTVPASSVGLDDVLTKLGLDKKAAATADDMTALREELKETSPLGERSVVKSVSANQTGALTEQKLRAEVQAFLDFVPALKANALPKLQISVGALRDANGMYNGGGRVALSSRLSEKERQRVVFHELMHWLHMEGPKSYKDEITAHWKMRTAGESVQPLPRYRGARGKKDDWYDVYAGKVYSVYGEGLEVPTRYIEWLTMEPAKMAALWNDAKFRETMKIVLKGLF